jgi:hypothetical protein
MEPNNKNDREKRIFKLALSLVLIIVVYILFANIYLAFFWKGGWGQSIVDIMYWVIRK